MKAIISLLSILISYVLSQKCELFSCVDLDGNKCAHLTRVNDVLEHELKACPNKDTQYCPWNMIEVDQYAECQELKGGKPKSYPGGPCETSANCMKDAVCNEQNICAGLDIGAPCQTALQCTIGNTCLKVEDKKTCQPQVEIGGKCDSDWDCVNKAGCYKNICTEYFSLDNGEDVTGVKTVLSLCKSGFEHNGKCQSLSNSNDVDSPCNDDVKCSYKNDKAEDIIIEEFCECGKNPTGDKYCKLGSAHELYQQYVADLKKVNELEGCHTLERNLCGKLQSDEQKDLFKSYSDKSIKALKYHELRAADDCVADVVYPKYVNDSPVKKVCPVYHCGKEDPSTCAVSKKNATYIDVLLTPCKNHTLHCDVNEADILKKPNTTAKCVEPAAPTAQRLPGEECSHDDDCLKVPGTTTTGKCSKTCSGAKGGEKCVSDQECLVGLFCTSQDAANPGTCKGQVKEKGACTRENECQNGYGCYNKTCTKYFSLNDGADVSDEAVTGFISDRARLCKHNMITAENKCTGRYTHDVIDKKSGLVKCDLGQQCNYTDHLGATYSLKCQCGRNAHGYSFCPKTHNETSSWNSYFKEIGNTYTNKKCHSFNRFNCYSNDNSALKSVRKYRYQTVDAHLYYDAPDCVYDVFESSSSFTKVSFFALIALIAFLF